ncbi:MAG TPA: RsmD family RNA methyltransferase, partial [Candidatus Kapabacteria bacterium]|nr:RsmD family RNA methyltransferase [Candidatus Kapabacteria bacterium]
LRDFIRPGSRILDLFANDGGFSINAALAGAESVVAVDESAPALERLAHNAELNGVQNKIETVTSDCFNYVREARGEFDVIVLDPPALAKSKKDIPNARKGYLALNSAAMRLMSKDGILITCSCSHHISRSLFLDILHEAGRRVKRTVTILEARGAGIDHPLLAAMPETEYLKVFFLNVH